MGLGYRHYYRDNRHFGYLVVGICRQHYDYADHHDPNDRYDRHDRHQRDGGYGDDRCDRKHYSLITKILQKGALGGAFFVGYSEHFILTS
jgi:hypothetical protein